VALKEAFYLPSFQISAASFQSLPIFSHTTTHLPVTSCGVEALVLRLRFRFSRAVEPCAPPASGTPGPACAGPETNQAYIGGVMPSRPTEMAAASSVPSSFLLAAEMKILTPGLSSLLSAGT
jgi:hypothetical protein